MDEKEKRRDPYEGWVKCCYQCKNRDKDQYKCHNGEPYYECPNYNKEGYAGGIYGDK